MTGKKKLYRLAEIAQMMGVEDPRVAERLLKRHGVVGIPRKYEGESGDPKMYTLHELCQKMPWGPKSLDEYNVSELETLMLVLERLDYIEGRLDAFESALELYGPASAPDPSKTS